MISCLPCVLTPKKGCELWGTKGDDDYTPGFGFGIGASIISLGALNAFLAWGVEPITAVGYTCSVGTLLHLKSIFFTPETDGFMEGKELTYLVWPIINAATAATILL